MVFVDSDEDITGQMRYVAYFNHSNMLICVFRFRWEMEWWASCVLCCCCTELVGVAMLLCVECRDIERCVRKRVSERNGNYYDCYSPFCWVRFANAHYVNYLFVFDRTKRYGQKSIWANNWINSNKRQKALLLQRDTWNVAESCNHFSREKKTFFLDFFLSFCCFHGSEIWSRMKCAR